MPTSNAGRTAIPTSTSGPLSVSTASTGPMGSCRMRTRPPGVSRSCSNRVRSARSMPSSEMRKVGASKDLVIEIGIPISIV